MKLKQIQQLIKAALREPDFDSASGTYCSQGDSIFDCIESDIESLRMGFDEWVSLSGEPTMNTYYLTFGSNTGNGGKYTVIHAPGISEARQMAFDKYGPAWCFVYDEDAYASAIEPYNLEVLETLTYNEEVEDGV